MKKSSSDTESTASLNKRIKFGSLADKEDVVDKEEVVDDQTVTKIAPVSRMRISARRNPVNEKKERKTSRVASRQLPTRKNLPKTKQKCKRN